MGVVFEGVDRILNRAVAIKVLSPHLVGDGEAKSRFLREAQAAASLAHENVVAIHAIDEADGMPYLVLQFVDGESLAERLARERKLPFADAVRIGIQTARGLATAHAHGLVHRDIKPANLLLEAATGDVRIADFGLAKRAGFDPITQAGVIAGTPAYMSPEQARDGDLNARSDLFSLGVVLYEACSGDAPFAADSPFAVLDKIRTRDPRAIREVNPDLPAWFGTIVHRLLEKKPEDRIASAAELAGLLDRESAVAPAKRASQFGSRRLVLGLAVVGVIGLSIGAAVYFRREDAPPSRPPVVGFVVEGFAEPYSTLAEAIQAAPDDGVIEVHGDGPYPTPTLTIDGKRLTIRAAPGATPRFVPDVTGDRGPPQFLNTNTDLRLEGIEVIWPTASPQSNLEDVAQRCVVGSSKGKLALTHCRVVAGPFGVCVGSSGREVVVERSHLVSASGACVAWRPTLAAVRVEQGFLEGKVALYASTAASGTAPTRVHFASNTVVAERLLTLVAHSPVRKSMGITASRNVIDTQLVVALYAFGGFPQGPAASARMTDAIRDAVAWKDESNVYRKGTLYLVGNPPLQPRATLPSDLKSLDKWLVVWKQPAAKSVEGVIRFGERAGPSDTTLLQLMNVDSPSGPLPPDVGAGPSIVGPGKIEKSSDWSPQPVEASAKRPFDGRASNSPQARGRAGFTHYGVVT